MTDFKSIIRAALYYSGVFGAIHRIRNRRTLTTLMFHRVLPDDSYEYACAEREFTFTLNGFGRCLDFVKKHYNVVKLEDVLNAANGVKSLPPNAALITIDDGWRDTILYATPELKRRELSAVLFLSTEVLSSLYDRWWQDVLASLLKDANATQRLADVLGLLGPDYDTPRHQDLNKKLAAQLATLPEGQRFEFMGAALPGVLTCELGRQMLARAEIGNIDRNCIELAAHGHTHAPLTELVSATNELQQSFDIISGNGACPVAMSFPHGAFDARLLNEALKIGFKLTFTSVANLSIFPEANDAPRGIGRIHVPENEWTTHAGLISCPLLATFLFFRPHDP